jgi:hypothetical protein
MGTLRALLALITVGVAFASTHLAQAQNTYSLNIVGYVNTIFRPGENLFGNPLDKGTNTLSSLFFAPPSGTTVSLWDSGSMTYNQSSTYNAGSWSLDLTLFPGTGARLTTGNTFTNTFVGNVVATYGPPPANEILPATLFNGAPGLHLLSSVSPFGYPGTYEAFDVIVGRAPITGDQFTWLDELTQTYHTTTYNATLGLWDNGQPVLGAGEAAFFNVMAVPEPSVTALLLVGAGILGLLRRKPENR